MISPCGTMKRKGDLVKNPGIPMKFCFYLAILIAASGLGSLFLAERNKKNQLKDEVQFLEYELAKSMEADTMMRLQLASQDAMLRRKQLLLDTVRQELRESQREKKLLEVEVQQQLMRNKRLYKLRSRSQDKESAPEQDTSNREINRKVFERENQQEPIAYRKPEPARVPEQDTSNREINRKSFERESQQEPIAYRKAEQAGVDDEVEAHELQQRNPSYAEARRRNPMFPADDQPVFDPEVNLIPPEKERIQLDRGNKEEDNFLHMAGQLLSQLEDNRKLFELQDDDALTGAERGLPNPDRDLQLERKLQEGPSTFAEGGKVQGQIMQEEDRLGMQPQLYQKQGLLAKEAQLQKQPEGPSALPQENRPLVMNEQLPQENGPLVMNEQLPQENGPLVMNEQLPQENGPLVMNEQLPQENGPFVMNEQLPQKPAPEVLLLPLAAEEFQRLPEAIEKARVPEDADTSYLYRKKVAL